MQIKSCYSAHGKLAVRNHAQLDEALDLLRLLLL